MYAVAEFENGVVLFVVVPVEDHTVVGAGRFIQQFEHAVDHLGGGAVEIRQAEIEFDVAAIHGFEVALKPHQQWMKKFVGVFRIGFAGQRERVLGKTEIDFGRMGGAGEIDIFHGDSLYGRFEIEIGEFAFVPVNRGQRILDGL